jgi:thioredoxin reductase
MVDEMERLYDAIIVGAGPAGLNAALIFGRCRRRCMVCDTGNPCNAASHALHGFLSRDGIEPAHLLRLGREQLRPYDTVQIRPVEVTDALPRQGGFEVVLKDGRRIGCRKLLLATGMIDPLPRIEGAESLYGRSVFHCPYCDGWEMRDQPLAVLGKGESGCKFALEMTQWSRDLVFCTNGPSGLSDSERERLRRNRVGLREERIVRLEHADGVLQRVVFASGATLPRRAVFFHSEIRPHSPLAAKLGCKHTESGTVPGGECGSTSVPGLYVAGDASGDVRQAIVAAAEGVRAAVAINTALLKEDLA